MRASKSRPTPLWLYGIVVGCSASLITLGLVLYDRTSTGASLPPTSDPGGSSSVVEVLGFDLIISYWTSNASDASYFKSPECGPCPTSLAPASEWRVGLTLTNLDKSRVHDVSNLSLGSPFGLVEVQPQLPIAVEPGGSVTLQVLIGLPAGPGSYFLPGSIGTS